MFSKQCGKFIFIIILVISLLVGTCGCDSTKGVTVNTHTDVEKDDVPLASEIAEQYVSSAHETYHRYFRYDLLQTDGKNGFYIIDSRENIYVFFRLTDNLLSVEPGFVRVCAEPKKEQSDIEMALPVEYAYALAELYCNYCHKPDGDKYDVEYMISIIDDMADQGIKAANYQFDDTDNVTAYFDNLILDYRYQKNYFSFSITVNDEETTNETYIVGPTDENVDRISEDMSIYEVIQYLGKADSIEEDPLSSGYTAAERELYSVHIWDRVGGGKIYVETIYYSGYGDVVTRIVNDPMNNSVFYSRYN